MAVRQSGSQPKHRYDERKMCKVQKKLKCLLKKGKEGELSALKNVKKLKFILERYEEAELSAENT